jgi:hypothetical protein
MALLKAEDTLPAAKAGSALGRQWVLRANLRDRGVTEFRHVRMSIGDTRPRVLEVRTLRQIRDGMAISLFCIIEPFGLRNINYVVSEVRGAMEPFSIQLYLPYVAGTLRDLPSDRRMEGHLGSDFSYEDLKVWLYAEDHVFAEPEERPEGVFVHGRCVARRHLVRHGSGSLALWLDPESAFVHGIDYFSGRGELCRKYRAEGVTTIDHVLVPDRMTLRDFSLRHVTTIDLVSAWYNRPVDPDIFTPALRRKTREYLLSI